jgi:hypothetical protein
MITLSFLPQITRAALFGVTQRNGNSLSLGSPSWQKIFSQVVSFSILSLFIYKFGDYQNIVSNKSNDKRRNLGWNHSVTKSELNQKTVLHSKIYCLQQKPVLQRLLELLIDTVVSKCIHNLCAFRGINFIPRLVLQVESVEDYLF